LTDNDKTFFIESLMLWIHHYRLQEPGREKFKHAIIIEEAHHVLLKHKQSKESIMDVILREIRELGESIILIDQHPSLISIPSLGNTYTTIAMNLKHARDVVGISEAMLIDSDERDYLGTLEPGVGIVKLQGRYPRPFLVRFPLIEVRKGSVDDEILRSRFPTSSTFTEVIPSPVPKQEHIPPVPPEDKVGDLIVNVTDNEKSMLVDVMQHALSGVAERYKRLSLNPRRGIHILSSLLSKSFLSSSFVSIPEGRVRFIQITEQGIEVLAKLGFEYRLGRRGGPEHEYWKHRVAESLRRAGFVVQIEYGLGDGQSIDLVAKKDEAVIAVEIETGKSEVERNISRDLKLNFNEVICFALASEIPSCLSTLFPNELAVGKLRNLTPKMFLNYSSKGSW